MLRRQSKDISTDVDMPLRVVSVSIGPGVRLGRFVERDSIRVEHCCCQHTKLGCAYTKFLAHSAMIHALI